MTQGLGRRDRRRTRASGDAPRGRDSCSAPSVTYTAAPSANAAALPAAMPGPPLATRQGAGSSPDAAISGHAAADRLFLVLGALIVLLALLLRCWRLDLAEFKQDELDVTRLALALAQHGQWPARGILSSVGTYNGPLFIALEALPALFWPTPLAMTAFVAALNVAAVAGTLLFARRYFGPAAALAAGAAFATAPWAVLFGRKIWEQDTLPPFVLLFFVGLFLVVVDRRPWWLLLCGAAASLAMQLHPSAIVLPLVALAALACRPRRFAPGPVAAALGIGLLLLVPYLAQEWRYGFADWAAAMHQPAAVKLSHPVALLVSVINWAQAASGWQVLGSFTADGQSVADPLYASLADFLAWFGLLSGAVLLVGRLRSSLRRGPTAPGTGSAALCPTADALLLLALWLLLPPLVLGATGMLTYSHYFIVTYPAPFLAIGLVFSHLAATPWRRAVGGALVAVLAACNTLTVLRVVTLAAQAPAPALYGLPLVYSEQAAVAISDDAGGAPAALTVAPGYRDGEAVLAQLVRWDAARATPAPGGAPRTYWLQPAYAPAPAGARVLRQIGPAGAPALTLWVAAGNQEGTAP